MKIRSAALTVALLAFVAGPYAAPRFASATSSKRSTHQVKLGSTTVISGARTGFVTIRIPKEAVLSGDQGSNPDFNVTGEGLFGGFFLQKEDRKGLAILGGRLPSGGAFGPPGSKEILLPFFGDFASEYELEPGTYRLYLVADGPTKVTIRFDGLKGHRRLRVSDHTSIDAKMLPVRTAVQGQTNIYSAGGVSEIKGYGFLLQYLSIKSDAWVAGEFGNCTYRGRPEESGALAWLPFCPLASDAVLTSFRDAVIRPFGGQVGFYNATLGLTAGHWTASTWYEAAALVEEADSIGVWVSLD